MSGLLMFPPHDLSSDEGGDEDSPLPDQSINDDEEYEQEPEEEPEEEDEDQCRTRAA